MLAGVAITPGNSLRQFPAAEERICFIAHNYMFLAKLIAGLDLVRGSTELHHATLILNLTLWLHVS